MRKKIVIIFLYTFYTVYLIAQNIIDGTLNIQSPNVASLGVYGEVPVSPFTGTPNIDIPLYSFYVNRQKFPISLSYHPSAVKPDQHPGWVGLGWTLNAGGVIYRKINDIQDEYSYNGYDYGYYYQHSILDTISWNYPDYLDLCASQTHIVLKDTAPDEFCFSFLDYSGVFYMDHNGNWVVKCNKPLRVEFDDEFYDNYFSFKANIIYSREYPKVFSGFTIIGEDGTKYIFGKTEDSIEYSMGIIGETYNQWYANSWYLTKIIYANDREIDLVYERGDFVCQLYNNYLYKYSHATSSSGSYSSQSYASNIMQGNNGQNCTLS